MGNRKRVQPLIRIGDAPPSSPTELDEEPLFLTQEQAARRLHIGKTTLKEWIGRGIIYAIPVGRRQLRIPVAEIEQFRRVHHGVRMGYPISRQTGYDLPREDGLRPTSSDG
jgi:excisionase family DNA binding protein